MSENDFGADPANSGMADEHSNSGALMGDQKPVVNPEGDGKRTRKPKDGKKSESLSNYAGHSGNVVETLAFSLTPDEFKGYLKGNIIAFTLGGTDDSAKSLVQYTKWLNEFITTGKITNQKEE